MRRRVIEVGFGSILTELVHQKRYNEKASENHTFVLDNFAITGIDVNGVNIDTDIPHEGMIVDGTLSVHSHDGFIIINQHQTDSFLIHTNATDSVFPARVL